MSVSKGDPGLWSPGVNDTVDGVSEVCPVLVRVVFNNTSVILASVFCARGELEAISAPAPTAAELGDGSAVVGTDVVLCAGGMSETSESESREGAASPSEVRCSVASARTKSSSDNGLVRGGLLTLASISARRLFASFPAKDSTGGGPVDVVVGSVVQGGDWGRISCWGPRDVSANCEGTEGCAPPAAVNAECAGSLSCTFEVVVEGVAEGTSYIEGYASALTWRAIPHLVGGVRTASGLLSKMLALIIAVCCSKVLSGASAES